MKFVQPCVGVQSEICLAAWSRKTRWHSLTQELRAQSWWQLLIRVQDLRKFHGSTIQLLLHQDLALVLTESLLYGTWKILISQWQKVISKMELVYLTLNLIVNMICCSMLEGAILTSSTGSSIVHLQEWWLHSTSGSLQTHAKLLLGCQNGL